MAALLAAATPAGAGVVHKAHESARSIEVRARQAAPAGTPSLAVPLPSVSPTADTARPPAHSVTAAGPVTPVDSAAAPKVLYLTFDDGPDPHWTPQVLAILARNHATATFFQIGEQVRAHPQTAAAVRAAGHSVGNHTAHHRRLTALSPAQLRAEISGGAHPASCLRPPFGAVDARVRAMAASLGQQIVLWNVDTEDWSKPGVAAIERHLLRDVQPGRTVLMHDGGGNRAQTIAALAAVLPRLAARGYLFASVPGC